MPDIREPYPVKPVWPTRPDRPVGERKRHKPEDERKKRREKEREHSNDRPSIDDYA